jgi:hypothetical protein
LRGEFLLIMQMKQRKTGKIISGIQREKGRNSRNNK